MCVIFNKKTNHEKNLIIKGIMCKIEVKLNEKKNMCKIEWESAKLNEKTYVIEWENNSCAKFNERTNNVQTWMRKKSCAKLNEKTNNVQTWMRKQIMNKSCANLNK